jgi:hypothetical protein
MLLGELIQGGGEAPSKRPSYLRQLDLLRRFIGGETCVNEESRLQYQNFRVSDNHQT